MGRTELATTSSEAYTHMDRMSRAILFNEPKPRYAFGFVHVEDCARVHVEALSSANVEDADIPDWFIAAATTPSGRTAQEIWKEAGDVLEEKFPMQVADKVFTVGRKNLPINIPFKVDSTLTEDKLLGGRQFKSLVGCVEEVAQWYTGLIIGEGETEEAG